MTPIGATNRKSSDAGCIAVELRRDLRRREMGDKTQLVAMINLLRYRWWIVLSAIFHRHYRRPPGLGGDRPLPGRRAADVSARNPAGAMFVFFGLWTLRGDSLTDDEASKTKRPPHRPSS